VTFIITTVRSLVNSYFYIFIPISQISEAGLCPAGQFLKSLRWGLPQSPVIASRAVRLCMSSGRFAVTGRNKKLGKDIIFALTNDQTDCFAIAFFQFAHSLWLN